ncbi:hypothetical protein E2C01_047490 [Portunus trituberculatus]|uniref:Uncharacterized protein n=1 Tax=Portunus trituberculatus TaxID=210409 RepID=A0A5B7G0J4_PORTR|nr:hypothetical protein [Portunus trituberculatus]
MFLQKLPWEVRVTLSSLEESTSDLVFISAADRVVSQLSSPSQLSTLASFPVPASPSLVTGNTVENQASAKGLAMATTFDAPYRQILQCLEVIEEQLRALLPRQGHISYNRFSASRPSSAGSSNEGLCWYHATFGSSARQCRSPCRWSGNDYRGSR